jgi:uncharacterized protein (TIGR02145 family)
MWVYNKDLNVWKRSTDSLIKSDFDYLKQELSATRFYSKFLSGSTYVPINDVDNIYDILGKWIPRSWYIGTLDSKYSYSNAPAKFARPINSANSYEYYTKFISEYGLTLKNLFTSNRIIKDSVDNYIPVYVATILPINLSQTYDSLIIDGITVKAGNMILVKDQEATVNLASDVDPNTYFKGNYEVYNNLFSIIEYKYKNSENGIYLYDGKNLIKQNFLDDYEKCIRMSVYVESGKINGGKQFHLSRLLNGYFPTSSNNDPVEFTEKKNWLLRNRVDYNNLFEINYYDVIKEEAHSYYSNGVTYSIPERTIAVGEFGVILNTQFGISNIIPNKYKVDLRSISKTTTDYWVCGDDTTLLKVRKHDFEVTHIKIDSLVKLNSISFFDDLRGVVVGDLNTILLTTDAGQTWNRLKIDDFSAFTYNKVLFSDFNRIYIVGRHGVFLEIVENVNGWTAYRRRIAKQLDEDDEYLLVENINDMYITNIDWNLSYTYTNQTTTTNKDLLFLVSDNNNIIVHDINSTTNYDFLYLDLGNDFGDILNITRKTASDSFYFTSNNGLYSFNLSNFQNIGIGNSYSNTISGTYFTQSSLYANEIFDYKGEDILIAGNTSLLRTATYSSSLNFNVLDSSFESRLKPKLLFLDYDMGSKLNFFTDQGDYRLPNSATFSLIDTSAANIFSFSSGSISLPIKSNTLLYHQIQIANTPQTKVRISELVVKLNITHPELYSISVSLRKKTYPGAGKIITLMPSGVAGPNANIVDFSFTTNTYYSNFSNLLYPYNNKTAHMLLKKDNGLFYKAFVDVNNNNDIVYANTTDFKEMLKFTTGNLAGTYDFANDWELLIYDWSTNIATGTITGTLNDWEISFTEDISSLSISPIIHSATAPSYFTQSEISWWNYWSDREKTFEYWTTNSMLDSSAILINSTFSSYDSYTNIFPAELNLNRIEIGNDVLKLAPGFTYSGTTHSSRFNSNLGPYISISNLPVAKKDANNNLIGGIYLKDYLVVLETDANWYVETGDVLRFETDLFKDNFVVNKIITINDTTINPGTPPPPPPVILPSAMINKRFGYLYNWNVVGDSRKIENPSGGNGQTNLWSVPSKDDLVYLGTIIGNTTDFNTFYNVGKKLKLAGTIEASTGLWYSPPSLLELGTNIYNFDAVGSGFRNYSAGNFYRLGKGVCYWSKTNNFGNYYWRCFIDWNTSDYTVTSQPTTYGFSIRLVRSATIDELLLPNGANSVDNPTDLLPYIGNDGKAYKTTKIGNKIWLAQDLLETKFNDGSDIPEIINDADWAVVGATQPARGTYPLPTTISNLVNNLSPLPSPPPPPPLPPVDPTKSIGRRLIYMYSNFNQNIINDLSSFGGYVKVWNLNKYSTIDGLITNFNYHPLSNAYSATQSNGIIELSPKFNNKTSYYNLGSKFNFNGLSSTMSYTDGFIKFGYSPRYNLLDYMESMNTNLLNPSFYATKEYLAMPIYRGIPVGELNLNTVYIDKSGLFGTYSTIITEEAQGNRIVFGPNLKLEWESIFVNTFVDVSIYQVGSTNGTYSVEKLLVMNKYKAINYKSSGIDPYIIEFDKRIDFDTNVSGSFATGSTIDIISRRTLKQISDDLQELNNIQRPKSKLSKINPYYALNNKYTNYSSGLNFKISTDSYAKILLSDSDTVKELSAIMYTDYKNEIAMNVTRLDRSYSIPISNTIDYNGQLYINCSEKHGLVLGDGLVLEFNGGTFSSQTLNQQYFGYRFVKQVINEYDFVVEIPYGNPVYVGNDTGYVKYLRKDPFFNYQPVDLIEVGLEKRANVSIKLDPDNVKLSGATFSLTNVDYNRYRYRLLDGLTLDKVNSRFPWLLEAEVSDAVVGLNDSNQLRWYKGTWEAGRWFGGEWISGTWKYGDWYGGTWSSQNIVDNGLSIKVDENSSGSTQSIWYTGRWYDGTWNDGTWVNGRWYGGTWERGTWNNGIWNDGTWNYGRFIGGIWVTGTWNDGIFNTDNEPSFWINGNWNGGDFENGIWYNGFFGEDNARSRFGTNAYNSRTAIWYGGKWKSGAFYSRLSDTDVSDVHKYSIWHSGQWMSGDFRGGVAYNMTFNSGTWYGGILEEIELVGINSNNNSFILNGLFKFNIGDEIYIIDNNSNNEYSKYGSNSDPGKYKVLNTIENTDTKITEIYVDENIDTTNLASYKKNSGLLNLSIPNNSSQIVSTQSVPYDVTTTNEIRVKLNLTNNYISDLIINLVAPNGDVINLKEYGAGGSQSLTVGVYASSSYTSMVDTIFTTDSSNNFYSGTDLSPTYTETYEMSKQLSHGYSDYQSSTNDYKVLLSNGSVKGDWVLYVKDNHKDLTNAVGTKGLKYSLTYQPVINYVTLGDFYKINLTKPVNYDPDIRIGDNIIVEVLKVFSGQQTAYSNTAPIYSTFSTYISGIENTSNTAVTITTGLTASSNLSTYFSAGSGTLLGKSISYANIYSSSNPRPENKLIDWEIQFVNDYEVGAQINYKREDGFDTGLRVVSKFKNVNWKSGIWTNGIYDNGVFEGGIWYNGIFNGTWG